MTTLEHPDNTTMTSLDINKHLSLSNLSFSGEARGEPINWKPLKLILFLELNLARGLPLTTQSATFNNNTAARAVDGDSRTCAVIDR